MRPYVGITGFDHGDQPLMVRKALPADRLLMVGACMHGDPRKWEPAKKWPNRTPPLKMLREIFSFAPYDNMLNMLHFTPPEGGDLGEHMCRAHEASGTNLHGIQLNTVELPDVKALLYYRGRFSRAVITIAARRQTIASLGRHPARIADHLVVYDGIADYVIVDPSEGNAEELDSMFLLRCFEEIASRMPHLGLVAAGGLCADNVSHKLSVLAQNFPICTDAEGKLRTRNDHLYVAEAIRYATTTDALLREFEAVRNSQSVN